MPAMLRIKGKATDIAYKILGVPENMRTDKKSRRSNEKKVLDYEETRLVK